MKISFSALFLSGISGESGYHNLQWNSDNKCELNAKPALLYEKCWFCACDTCKLDILFLIDQSENAEPLCDNPLIKLDLQEVFSSLQDEDDTTYNYADAKAQIDYAIDAIDIVPQAMLDDQRVRIAAAVYGQQEDIEKVFNFGSTNKMDMKCKLYGYDSEADCDLTVFKRKPLCYQAGVYQALKWAAGIDIFTATDTVSPAEFTWREHTTTHPVTKAMVLTAADEFRSTDVNEDNIASYLDAIHDATNGGFDKIYAVGKVDEDRARTSEVNFWRDLNEIACRNPQSCDQTSMYDVTNAGRSASEQSSDDPFHNGATFMNAMIDPNSMTLNPYFCYVTNWKANCMVKPITYHPRSAVWMDEFLDYQNHDTDTDAVPYSQYPWHGIIPNSCCGSKPYNADIRCCDPVTQKLHSRCHDFDEDEEPAEGIIMNHVDHRNASVVESQAFEGHIDVGEMEGHMVMGEMEGQMVMGEMDGHTSKREAEIDYEGYEY